MYKKGLRRNTKIYYLSAIFRAGLFTIPIWIVYQEKFLSFEQISLFASLSLLMTIIFELPSGVLADLIGRKYTIALGHLFASLGFLVIGLAPSYLSMGIYVLMHGLGNSLISGALSAIIYDSLIELKSEDKYINIRSKNSIIFQIAASFAILTGGYTYQLWDGMPYFLRGALFCIGSLPFLVMTEPKIDTEKFNVKGYFKQIKIGFFESFKNAEIARISLLYILVMGIATSNHRFFSQPYMIELGLKDLERSWLAASIKILISLAALFITKNKKFLKSKYYLLLMPIIMSASLLPSCFISMPLALLVMIGVAFPSGSGDYFIGAAINQKIKSKYRATAISTLNMFVSALYAINTIIGGYVKKSIPISKYYSIIGLVVIIATIPLTIKIIKHNGKSDL